MRIWGWLNRWGQKRTTDPVDLVLPAFEQLEPRLLLDGDPLGLEVFPAVTDEFKQVISMDLESPDLIQSQQARDSDNIDLSACEMAPVEPTYEQASPENSEVEVDNRLSTSLAVIQTAQPVVLETSNTTSSDGIIVHCVETAPVVKELPSFTDQLIETLNAPHGPPEMALIANTTQEILFVDPAVKHDFRPKNAESSDVEVNVLDARRDGIQQITECLSSRINISAIHVLSHGAPGQVYIGTSVLNSTSLKKYRQALSTWGEALTQDGDILLYGCTVAQGNEGIELVDRIAQLTGADVAASTDDTGAAELSGDWILEYQTGFIEADLRLNTGEYDSLLSCEDLNRDTTADGNGPYAIQTGSAGAEFEYWREDFSSNAALTSQNTPWTRRDTGTATQGPGPQCWSPDAQYVDVIQDSAGGIAISALRLEVDGGTTYSTGAQLLSNEAYGYGRYRWRMRTAGDPGYVAAAYLYPTWQDVQAREYSEIDFEILSRMFDCSNGELVLAAWQESTDVPAGPNGVPPAGVDRMRAQQVDLLDPTVYHVYEIDWREDRIRFLVDGQQVGIDVTDFVPWEKALVNMSAWSGNSFSGTLGNNASGTVWVDWFEYMPVNAVGAPFVNSYSCDDEPDTNIQVTFSEDMNQATFTNQNITVSGTISGTHSSTFSFDRFTHTLTIDPSTDFLHGETVTVNIGTAVQDLSNNSLSQSSQLDFAIDSLPDKLAIYYGYPSAVNQAGGDVSLAKDVFDDYDIVVFGDTLQLPQHDPTNPNSNPVYDKAITQNSHEDHDKTAQIIEELVTATEPTAVYGYISLGGGGTARRENGVPKPLTLDEIKQFVWDWRNMGVTGIFLDEAGYGFGASRKGQNDVIDFIHDTPSLYGKNLSVFINAWNPDDLFKQDVVLAGTVRRLVPAIGVMMTHSSGNAMVTYASHGYADGEKVLISQASVAAYEGVHTVTYVDENTYSFALSGSPSSATATAQLLNVQITHDSVNSTATVTHKDHGYTTGAKVLISQAFIAGSSTPSSVAAYDNKVYTITVVDRDTYTFGLSGSGLANVDANAQLQMNPDGLPARLRPDDISLLESFQIIEGNFRSPDQWQDRADKALEYRHHFGTRMATVTTAVDDAPDGGFDQGQFDYAWWSTLLYGFDAMGWGEGFNFSAAGSCNGALPLRVRPHERPASDLSSVDAGLISSAFTSQSVTHDVVRHTRTTDAGVIRVTADTRDTGTYRGEFLPTPSGRIAFHSYTAYDFDPPSETWPLDGEIHIFDLESNTNVTVAEQTIAAAVQHALNPKFSPFGERLVFMGLPQGTANTADWPNHLDLFLYDFRSDTLTNLSAQARHNTTEPLGGAALSTLGKEEDPDFSPDGKQVIFKRDRSDLWTIDLQTFVLTQITMDGNVTEESGPRLSPDPDDPWVAYWTGSGANADIVRRKLSDGTIQVLVNNAGIQDMYPAYLDKDRLLYTRWSNATDRDDEVCLHDLITSTNTGAAFNQAGTADDSDPFAVGGNLVGFSSDRTGGKGGWDLFLGDLGSSKPLHLVDTSTPKHDLGGTYTPHRVVSPVNIPPRNVPLLGWWSGNERDKKFTHSLLSADELTLDLAGTNNGTLQNGTSHAPGKVEEVFSLDGHNDYISLGTGPALQGTDGTGPFTISAWIKTTESGVIIQQRQKDLVDGQYVLSIGGLPGPFASAPGEVGWATYNAGFGFNFCSTTPADVDVTDGSFHHIAAVRESDGTGRIYIDGIDRGSQRLTAPKQLNALEVFVGADKRDDIAFFQGLIDEVQIYKTALTPWQIQDLAQFSTGTVWPISGTTQPDYPIASTFGPRLQASLGDRYDWHRGIDIPAPCGTPVHAVEDGLVEKAGDYTTFADRMAQIKHTRADSSVYYSTYLHLSAIAPGISVGSSINKGDLIGFVGESGIGKGDVNSTADDTQPLDFSTDLPGNQQGGFDHLHFEIRDSGLLQKNAVHPLLELPYRDSDGLGGSGAAPEIAVSDIHFPDPSDPTRLEVKVKVTAPPEELDLDLVEVSVSDISGTILFDHHVFDMNQWNHDYTPFVGGISNVGILDTAPAYDGIYDGDYGQGPVSPAPLRVTVSPAEFNKSSDTYEVDLTFFDLQVPLHTDELRVEVEAKDIWGHSSIAGRTLPYSTEVTKMLATDAFVGDRFGTEIAISGNTMLVGAPGVIDPRLPSKTHGTAYVLQWDGSHWVQQAKLTASDGAPGNRFGSRVAISGSTIVVGALGNDHAGLFSGAVYVYQWDGSKWEEKQRLVANDAAAGDRFGQAVAVANDRIVVSASRADAAGTNSGAVYVFHPTAGTWGQQQKLVPADAAAGDALGAVHGVVISGDTIVVGAIGQDGMGQNAGAAYVYQWDGTSWNQQQKLTATDAEPFDSLGKYIAISGNTMAISAEADDDGGSTAGAIYVFDRDASGVWMEKAKLTANDAAAGDALGPVTIKGDRIVASAPFDDDTAPNSGSVYVFERTGSTWTQRTKLNATDIGPGTVFGRSAAIYGDNVAISAPTTHVGQLNFIDHFVEPQKGAIYLFDLSTPRLTEQAKLTASDAAPGDWFGSFTSISGDTVVVGATRDDSGIGITLGQPGLGNGDCAAEFNGLIGNRVAVPNSGSLNPTMITMEAVIEWSGPNGCLQRILEKSATTSPDVAVYNLTIREDGRVQVEISTEGNAGVPIVSYSAVSESPIQPGEKTHVVATYDGTEIKIYIDCVDVGSLPASGNLLQNTDRPLGIGNQAEPIIAGYPALVEWPFKGILDEVALYSTALSPARIAVHHAVLMESFDAEVMSDAPIGYWRFSESPGATTALDSSGNGHAGTYYAGESSGSAYVFSRDQGGANNWGQVAKLCASDAAAWDQFGSRTAISGDTIVVGADNDNDAGERSGSAYVFSRDAGGANNWGQVAKLCASDAVAGDWFGWFVAISGDTIVVGAYGDDDAGEGSGSAYVFSRDQGGPNNWGQVAKLCASDAAAGDRFGVSVAISGDTLVIGAGLDDDAGNNSGSAYVFSRNEGGPNNWGQVTKLCASDAAAGDLFGSSVAVSGNTVAVGAHVDDDAGESSGSVYVFQYNGTSWIEQAKLSAGDAAAGDMFGVGIAVSGDTIAVVAPLTDDPVVGPDVGSAYVFRRNGTSWIEHAKLAPSDAAANSQFGPIGIDISGNTVVVGRAYDNVAGDWSGSAYVFDLSDHQALWVLSDEVSSPVARATLVDRSADSGVDILYQSVYQSSINAAGRLMYEDADIADLITQARACGTEVWAAYGAPDWAGTAKSFALARMQEVNAYNSANPTARFNGVILDVEPPEPLAESDFQDLLTLYRDVRVTLSNDLKLAVAMRDFWDTPVVFPADIGPSKPAYQHIIDQNLDKVVVKGYRDFAGTGAADNGIIDLAQDEIAYARSRGKLRLILVGVETSNCSPACGPESVTFFEEGQTALNTETGSVAEHFADNPGFGGFAVHGYGDAYLGNLPNWPTLNTGFPTEVNTAQDHNVFVEPVDATTGTSPVALTFDEVTAAGITSLITSSTGPAVSTGFQMASSAYYDVTTTASFSGPVTVCIDYDESTISGPEANLRLLHYEDTTGNGVPNEWVDRTVSVDTANNVVCASVTSLSEFAVFESAALTEQAKLTASDAAVGDQFGFTTSISGDTVLVPAGGNDGAGTDAGAAYLFSRNEGGPDNWGQVAKLIASDAAPHDSLALGAISGDTVALGAYRHDSGIGITFGQPGLGSGDSAAKFSGLIGNRVVVPNSGSLNPTTITMEAVIEWSGPNGYLQRIMEKSATTSGDVAVYNLTIRDDGKLQVEISTEDNAGVPIASYSAVSETTVQPGQKTHVAATYDGTEIKIYINGVPVGSLPASGNLLQNTDRPLGIGNQAEPVITSVRYTPLDYEWPFNGTLDEVVLYAAALSPARIAAHHAVLLQSFDNEVISDAPIGYWRFSESPGATTAVDSSSNGNAGTYYAGEGSGSAYVFSRDEGGPNNWGQVAKLIASDAAAWDQFGRRIAISGDTIVVGAYGDDDAGESSGSAYVFSRNEGGPNNWGQVTKLCASDAAADDRFGGHVGISGNTIVVGAVRDDDAGENSGSAYVFQYNGTSWIEQAKLTAGDAAAGDVFGNGVAISGDTLVAVASRTDDPVIGVDVGSAYVFRRSGTSWFEYAKLVPSDPAENIGFARTSICGNTVVVGRIRDNAAGYRSGSAHVFDLSDHQALWVLSDEVSDAVARARLVDRSADSGVDILYQSVYKSSASAAGRLMYEDTDIADLITQARARGTEVWAAHGAPDWAGTAKSFALARMQEVNDYNSANPTAKFDGVILDVEPPEPLSESDFQDLLTLYRDVRATLNSDLKLAVAIQHTWDTPVAFPAHTGPVKAAYQHIIDQNLDKVVVKGYGDFAGTGVADNGIIDLAQDEIAYARSRGKLRLILVGVETSNGSPGSFFEEGQTALNIETRTVAEHFADNPGFGGFAIHGYGDAYLGNLPNWPTLNPGFPTEVNTAQDHNVFVEPVDTTTGTTPVALTFSTVTLAGNTSLTTSTSGPTIPSAYRPGDPPIYYDLTTTAGFETSLANDQSPVVVEIQYDEAAFTGPEEGLRLLHYEDTDSNGVSDTWVDRTDWVDTTNNTICAGVDSLSPFVILERYAPTDDLFPNPERGFYHYTETHSNNYTPLDLTGLQQLGTADDPVAYRQNRDITLVQRYFYLEDFVDSPISPSYLSAMQTDFNRLRAAGLKTVIRFAYSNTFDHAVPGTWSPIPPYGDATKERILEHIDQLAPILVENQDVIAVVQAGFIGTWGEWFNTDHFVENPEEPWNITPDDYAKRAEVLNALLAALPTRMVQVRTPFYKQNIYGTGTGAASALPAADAHNGSNLARVGHHNDGFLASDTDLGTYVDIVNDKAYLAEETKYLPMGGETSCCELNPPRSDWPTALDELAQFHWSFLNIDRYLQDSGDPGVPATWGEPGLEEVQRRLGYRFALVAGAYADEVKPGEAFAINIEVRNDGWAAPFNARPVELVLRHAQSGIIYKARLPDDPRFWLASDTETYTLDHTICTPGDMPLGDYELLLNLPDAESSLRQYAQPAYSIRLANEGVWEENTGYNDLLHTLAVTDTAPSTGCPADSLTLELEGSDLRGRIAFHSYTEYDDDNTDGYHSIDGIIQVYDLATNTHYQRAEATIASQVQHAMNPKFSPDGSRLVFMGLPKTHTYEHTNDAWANYLDIFLYDLLSDRVVNLSEQALQGGTSAGLTDYGKVEEDPDFSPDGRRVIFKQDRSDLWEVSLDSLEISQITNSPSVEESGPRYSPDGQTIVFWEGTGANAGIYEVPATAGPHAQSTLVVDTGGIQEMYPAFQDNDHLLYSRWVSSGDHHDQIYLHELATQTDTAAVFSVTTANDSDPFGVTDPIVGFSSDRSGKGGYDLFVGDSNTGEIRWLKAASTAKHDLGGSYTPVVQTIAVPAYIYPTGPVNLALWDQIEDASPTVGLVVINPGFYAIAEPYWEEPYETQVTECQDEGLRVIAYVPTTWGDRDIDRVKYEIDKFYDFYDVDGIFLDEVSTQTSYLAYYEEIYDYIKNKPAVRNTLTVLNPGGQTDESYMSVSDILVTFEGYYANPGPSVPDPGQWYEDNYLAPSWVSDYPASRFWHLVHTTGTIDEMAHAVRLSQDRNVGWIYVTPDEMLPYDPINGYTGNPWDSFPPDGSPGSYWSAELAAVRPPTDPPLSLCVETTEGLVGWWPGDGSAIDIVRGNHGTIHMGGSPSSPYTVGKVGRAFSLGFDGHQDYVSLGTAASVTGTGPFTVEAWVATTDQGVIIQQRDPTPDGWKGQYILGVGVWSATSGQVSWVTYGDDGTPGFNLSSNSTVDDGLFHHIVALREADGTAKIYIDGVLDSEQSAPSRSLAPLGVFVGADVRDSDKFLKGIIDEVGIYDRALTQSEIQAIFNAGSAGKCKQPAPTNAAWMYGFSEWDNATEVAYLSSMGINQVFLSVDSKKIDNTQTTPPANDTYDTAYTAKLVDFITRANAQGISIHAMTLQDPDFTLTEKHADALERIDHILAYCDQNPDAAFDGIHIDTEPHALQAWKDADWTTDTREQLMQQFVALAEQIRSDIDSWELSSGVSLEFSAAVAWWYNERAAGGNLPSGDAALLAQSLDVLVPMVYGGIGGSAQDIINRSSDEIPEAATLVGIGATEFSTYSEILGAVNALRDEFGGRVNYLGTSVFKYETLKQKWELNTHHPIEVTLVDDESTTNFCTFQSFNQKVLQNEYGIFMTHLHSQTQTFDAQTWRLSRSVDGGHSFDVIHEETHGTNPPVIETDLLGNIYLMRQDYYSSSDSYLYIFSPLDNYSPHDPIRIPDGGGGMYSMLYDSIRNCLYYFNSGGPSNWVGSDALNARFYSIGLDGQVIHSKDIVKDGPNGQIVWPLLAMDENGVLYAAWTNHEGIDPYTYRSIHFMRSTDGGDTWEKLDETLLEVPVFADDTGPTDRVTLESEYGDDTWLWNFLAKNGKLHFAYQTYKGYQSPDNYVNYVRYDIDSAIEDERISGEWKGNDVSLSRNRIAPGDGFVVSDPHHPNRSYWVSSDTLLEEGDPVEERLVVLYTDDNGDTWHDYAESEFKAAGYLYAIGGSRTLTSDGYIIGSFTDINWGPPQSFKPYFFKVKAGWPSDFVWPLSACSTADEMTTAFGPRVNDRKWDFHDGIDLPAPKGTPVYAARGGTVVRAGKADDEYSSRHVVLQVEDPQDGAADLYLVYLHLDTFLVAEGDSILQGEQIGTVGDDDATYPHLHFETRRGGLFEINSVHPLDYLPYTDTENFTAPALNRVNQLGGLRAVGLSFDAPDRNEGDLLGVKVDVKNASGVTIETRELDFNDKGTINEGNSDDFIYVNDIGIEGYQKSNMVDDGRSDLKYGILVRNIPDDCTHIDAMVIDLAGNEVTTTGISIPDLSTTETDENIDFDDSFPPSGWQTVTSTSGDETAVVTTTSTDYSGLPSKMMLSTDGSTTEGETQRAGIEFTLPEIPCQRFEWIAEGWFNPTALGLGEDQNLYPLYFIGKTAGGEPKLSVAARIRNVGTTDSPDYLAGIIAQEKPGKFKVKNCDETEPAARIGINQWRHWKLHLLRLGTRETTAVLYLDGEEQARLNWDTTELEPEIFRAGIGLTSTGATATVLTDDLRLSEKTHSTSVVSTPEGSDIAVEPVDATTGETPVAVTYDNIVESGGTTLTTSSMGPPPPANFHLAGSLYYDVTTTAQFTSSIEVCIHYNETTISGPEADLKLFHYEDTIEPLDGIRDTWVDRTISLDTTNNIICAQVDSLSPFAIFEPNQPPVAEAGGPYTVAEGDSVQLDASGTTDADLPSDVLTYEWDFDGDGDYDDASGATTDMTWHDDGVYAIGLKVTDSYGEFDTDSTTVTVNNVAPTVETIFLDVELTMRISGERGNRLELVIEQEGDELGRLELVRTTGAPGEGSVSVAIDLAKDYTATLHFESENGKGATPVWLGIDDHMVKITTFNAQKNKPDTWNQALEIDLDPMIFASGVDLNFRASASDAGSDDLSFTWDFGDGSNPIGVTYFNNGSGLDPDLSPDGTYPFSAIDKQTHAYSSDENRTIAYILTLRVDDDDDGWVVLTYDLVIHLDA